MSDVSQGPGWWQASNGKWYPPADADQPGPDWWLASDGNWYPPEQRTAPAEPDPAVRKPVKPIAKPVARSEAAGQTGTPTPPRGASTTRRGTAAMGTPAGPAVAPTAAPAATTKASTGPSPAKTNGRPPASAPAATSARPAATTPPTSAKKQPAAAPKQPAPAAKQPAAAPKGPNAAPVTPPARPRSAKPVESAGGAAMSPDAQIRARNEQSRRDAAVLSGARKSAATRALGNISALLEQEQAAAREPGAAGAAAKPAPAAPTGSATGTNALAPKTRGKLGRVGRAATDQPQTGSPAPSTGARSGPAPEAIVDPVPPPSTDPPLLEVKQGTLSADIEHIGERLVIFNDRVELRDRNERVRQVIAGADIADVVVHKKFTGSTVTVEAGTGESIVAKGLKPEQADEIRSVILKRTRAGAPSAAPPATGRSERPDPREPIVDTRDPKPATADQRADLLAKLDDLHRAGVLTNGELAEKQALVERLLDGEPLAVSSPSA